MLDLIIRSGRIVDGSGLPAYHADVGVAGGRIVKLGQVKQEARQQIDAGGNVVAPGFIDPHTHFDAQLLWDGFAKPAIGVTYLPPRTYGITLGYGF